jgi:predicted DCC family thiol-disulfide oxidoreductase YuxK
VKHLLFFDEQCPLCQKAVKRVLKLDRKKQFLFASLSGKTAKHEEIHEKNTLVLIENYETTHSRIWRRGKGALRIFWLIGGPWKLLGLLSYLPGADLIYRWISHHRHNLSRKEEKFTPQEETRFLD